jgi:hypothetical protein
VVAVILGLGSAILLAAKEPSGQVVDSGTFGVFMKGRRVATETFSIRQDTNGSVTKSEFKTDQASSPAVQTSELQLSPNGDLLRYEWKEVSPGKGWAEVVPSNDFLMEHYTDSQNKQQEHPFLLPAGTSILDDYFFVHRQVLAWKYLAMACRQSKNGVECPKGQRTQFGTVNPHAQASLLATVEFAGREKVSIRGQERELNRLDLKSDAGEWSLWLDDQFKLMRIVVPGEDTEVVRD